MENNLESVAMTTTTTTHDTRDKMETEHSTTAAATTIPMAVAEN